MQFSAGSSTQVCYPSYSPLSGAFIGNKVGFCWWFKKILARLAVPLILRWRVETCTLKWCLFKCPSILERLSILAASSGIYLLTSVSSYSLDHLDFVISNKHIIQKIGLVWSPKDPFLIILYVLMNVFCQNCRQRKTREF